jgi:hypothetical protein
MLESNTTLAARCPDCPWLRHGPLTMLEDGPYKRSRWIIFARDAPEACGIRRGPHPGIPVRSL